MATFCCISKEEGRNAGISSEGRGIGRISDKAGNGSSGTPQGGKKIIAETKKQVRALIKGTERN
jgi:hypothetical protein